MDDDFLRRANPPRMWPSTRRQPFCRDALLTEAFLSDGAERRARSAARRAVSCASLADAGGWPGHGGRAGGDLAAQGQMPDQAMVEFIHVRKTGALILPRCAPAA
jgi:farnesyl diphosphate synthase